MVALVGIPGARCCGAGRGTRSSGKRKRDLEAASHCGGWSGRHVREQNQLKSEALGQERECQARVPARFHTVVVSGCGFEWGVPEACSPPSSSLC